MNTARRRGLLVTIIGLAACGGAARRADETSAASAPCGDAEAVAIDDATEAGRAFHALRGPLTGTLALRCPTDAACVLPEDRQIEVSVVPLRPVACAFAACRVPYLGSLPFALASDDPCPRVLWSVARVSLKTDRGALDDQVAEVNVLASPEGEGFLRFIIERPATLRDPASPGEARALLLDVQLEADGAQVRGQMSALAAKLPATPAPELHFAAIWTATWQGRSPP
jgi:hypothetical protein